MKLLSLVAVASLAVSGVTAGAVDGVGDDTAASSLEWHLAKDYGSAMLHAKAAYSSGEQTEQYYSRLPASAEKTTRPSIWGLSNDPAGLFLQFKTNSTSVSVNYTLGSSAISMYHFPSTGVSGLDLYSYDEGNATWRWVATTKPHYPVTTSALVTPSMSTGHSHTAGETRLYRLHLATYNEVRDDLQIGLDPGSSLEPDNSTLVGFGEDEAIVW